ncbi:M23 family metallopeptidase [Brevibacillus marinus]|uniref:M23 family metallopeptidase n=1 Tax=Brevibacillus marinus TaxID=2496837 RepID=UPI000F84801E|nr:M23 family metallopeptidase [Brevibacillus marinus]
MRFINGFLQSFIKFTLWVVVLFGVLLFLAFSALSWLFIMPMTYFETEGVIGFFTTGTDEWNTQRDKELSEQYHALPLRDLGSDEPQFLTPSQYDQAYAFRLSWALLAAVDRVLGDPTNNDKRRNPQPEKHYEALRPYFTWRDAFVIVKRKVIKQNGKVEWEIEKHKVKLLEQVDAYNAIHRLTYRKIVTTTEWVITEKYELDQVETEFLPKEQDRLTKLLESYHLPEKDQELIVNLSLAYVSDEWQETQYLLSQLNLNDLPDHPSFPDLPIGGGDNKWAGTFPLAGELGVDFRITSPFGYRRDPFNGLTSFHDGVDLAAPRGTPVYAPFEGMVIYAREMRGFGYTVMLQHGSYVSLYGHLNTIRVKKGETVRPGDWIGDVGSTGRSTGPHLHWSIYKNSFGKSNAIDPLRFISSK